MESKIRDFLSDDQLILYVRENDENAKDCLYEKFSPLIHKEVNRVKKRAIYLGIDFSDLTQEAMLAFSHAINNYKEDEDVKFITFATLCIRRKLANYIAKFETNKSKALLSSIPLDAPIDASNNTIMEQIESTDTVDPLKQVINDETLQEVKFTIANYLSENERIVLQYDLLGKSVSEIASLTGMNSKQIYNLIHRARNKIKL
ncbi:MAG: sigma-70 family RNA polymerase sigma factor [Bacilli bacterium]|nr:sigma-70 family RNA polymerase sigma factor [Bacilli bacterium]